ncbi:uncharacterized protein CG3556 [Caerostris darwini]|uniref:Uncharacterized protein CG3556 n=1 Tax=Caerostris darwini TaxID=1538125 RepID=A0AAV4P6E1_9ARAC|nr:uncharacterized protein CG3556 [Caerostris darwini]
MYAGVLSCALLLFALYSVGGSKDCGENEFPCDNGECVKMGLWCDGKKNCSDGSDETKCKTASLWRGSNDPNKCPKQFFKCNNGPCIPLKGRCDGYQSCKDQSDEKDCKDAGNRVSVDSSDTVSSHGKEEEVLNTENSVPPSVRRTPPPKTYRYSKHVPADSSHLLEMARSWLLSQRQHDFGWGKETPRALTALYLSDNRPPQERNDSDLLMIKQLEVQLALDMARNGSKQLELIDLVLYINALTASCKDPKNFHGNDLVLTLRNMVDSALYASKFVGPLVYMTLCMNNVTSYNDAKKIQEIFTSRNVALSRIDILSLAMLSLACMRRKPRIVPDSMYESFKQQFLERMNTKGLPGNVYEAALLKQAFNEMGLEKPELTSFLLSQQQEDGSFGSILATYLVLPVLANKNLLRMSDHCSQMTKHITDLEPIEVLKNKKSRRIHLRYSLNYGDPVEVSQSIQMQVAEGTNFLDIMRLAQEINPKFRFKMDENYRIPVVYSIGGVSNDAEKGLFWTLHVASNSGKSKTDVSRLIPYTESVKHLIPHQGDGIVFWIKPL